MAAERGGDPQALAARLVGVGQKHFEVADRARHAEKQLRRGQRHIDDAIVPFVEADIEQRDDVVGLEPRQRAEGGVGALGRDQRDLAADPDPETPRQPVAERDAVIAELAERAGDDMAGDQLVGAQARRGGCRAPARPRRRRCSSP